MSSGGFMDSVWAPLLITGAVPFLLTVICLGAAGLALLRQSQLGAAATVTAGCGFGALAIASALKIFLFYVQFSGMANHTPTLEIVRRVAWVAPGMNLFEIAGLVLVAIAMFQRRPEAQAG
jgi:hypothetical protein